MPPLRIATRKSPLALWQARHVAARLQETHPGLQVELVPISTRGDEVLDRSLAKIGGKGLFIKELEVAMQEGLADLAVHSMKDVPAHMPDGMTLACILERANAGDALVSDKHDGFSELPSGAMIGTSSLRRAAQLLNARPDLEIQPLRGNVGTRLAKLTSEGFDAIVLAAAGLHRLGLAARINSIFSPQLCMPAAGQGAIGIECCSDALPTLKLLEQLNDQPTWYCVTAERTANAALGSTCTSPVAAYATIKSGIITLRARVAAPDGAELLETVTTGDTAAAHDIGTRAANSLLELGARAYLDAADE